ncbi:hypothetical protein GALMADRAFT_81123 [Galerina marginata CBS 339.88]|uniref:Uncharacterized protein n=1 Tax=Galerina marginata (strain CBS 339.88) TaxID=685588 RepID=A0A067S8R7_GALM3|nr:hypothetical protein GALMADRAFT_81123 [Galerina marginata CBS 339.88]
MSSDDEKHNPTDVSDDELDSDADDETSKLLSSRESSPTPSDDTSELAEDPRFTQPSPSPMKRWGLVVFLAFLFWLGYQMRGAIFEGKKNTKVIHASRYSKEHKFRPAASPVITETLKDGRVRLRGALPAPTEPPKPVPRKKAATGKVSGKRKTRKPKAKSKSKSERRM